MRRFRVVLLGSPHVVLDGETAAAPLGAKPMALLAYLAVERGRPHRREALAGLLWPEQPESAARNSLRQALHQLRQALGEGTPPLLLITPQTVQFNLPAAAMLDVAAFERLLEDCRQHKHRRPEDCPACVGRLERAVALYGGDLLAELFLKDSVAFEEWVLLRREQYRRQALAALHTLAAHYARQGDFERMEQASRRQIELEPFEEEAHRQLLRALAWSGRPTAALAHYAGLCQMLARELDTVPERETEALCQQLRAAALPPPARPPLRNWPQQFTPLVGRSEEQAVLGKLLQSPQVRLVTVTGTGGVGKTRLALEAGAWEAPAFADGACFVPLAALSSPEFIVPAIASAMELPPAGPANPLAQLCARLRGKDLLLVLDNFEHLLAGASLVADLLAACPRLTILATSREPLHLRAEQVFRLAPLAVPDLARLPTAGAALAELAEVPAVALFVQRATATASHFVLNADNAAAVAELCTGLDGLPLAIELAAARMDLLTPAQLAAGLTHRLALLTDGFRDLPPRQQTLQATIEWSYRLLSAAEQQLFARLSLFAGGCTLEAARAVCGMDDGPAEAGIVAGLQGLGNKSLVQRQETIGREERFFLLETIREYAETNLASGERRALQRRHWQYYTDLVRQATTQLVGPQEARWLQRIVVEQNNLRAALGWAVEQGEADAAVLLSGSMWEFWYRWGHYDEGRRWLEAALRLPAGETGAVEQVRARARAAGGAGVLAGMQGDYLPAKTWLEESLRLARQLDRPAAIATALSWLGWVCSCQADYDRATACFDESLALARGIGPGARHIVAHALTCRGEMARFRGDYAAARAHYEECLAIWEELEAPEGIACTILDLGHVYLRQGEHARARECFRKSLALAQEIGTAMYVAGSIAGLAAMLLATGESTRAARLLGYAESLFRTAGVVMGPADRADYEGSMAAARTQLGEEAFAHEWAQGQALSAEEAVADALAEA